MHRWKCHLFSFCKIISVYYREDYILKFALMHPGAEPRWNMLPRCCVVQEEQHQHIPPHLPVCHFSSQAQWESQDRWGVLETLLKAKGVAPVGKRITRVYMGSFHVGWKFARCFFLSSSKNQQSTFPAKRSGRRGCKGLADMGIAPLFNRIGSLQTDKRGEAITDELLKEWRNQFMLCREIRKTLVPIFLEEQCLLEPEQLHSPYTRRKSI